MKPRALTLIVAALFTISAANAQEKNIPSKITHITVFSQGAQLSSEAVFSLPAGNTDLVVGGLSPSVDATSIQVTGEGDFMILGVNFRNNYLENPAESAKIADLRSRIDLLAAKIEDEGTAVEVLNEKEAFLKANYNVSAGKTSLTTDQMKAFLDLFSTSMETVKQTILKKTRLIKDYQKEKESLEAQLNLSVTKSKLPTGEIVVSASAVKDVNIKLNLSYVVPNAGWYPSYDIRVNDVDSPASIIYKANVWQNSGIDWDNIKLSLSSSSPMTSGSLPSLVPWYVDFYTPMYKMLSGKVAGLQVSKSRKEELVSDEAVNELAEEMPSSPPPVSISESSTSFSFDVNINQTVSSGGKPEVVELQRLTVPATYKYESVPKNSTSAFLMGYITDWSKYSLLAGNANIYFGNTFTGTGYINITELTDTLPVSLGADKAITIKREKRVDFSSHKFVGLNVVETRSFLISVRNNKKQNMEIKLHDQLPVSQNSSITVNAVELTGGKQDDQTGEVTWILNLAPQETKNLIFTYSVKYPKSQKVILE
jgi:uncharacterized protein (TIGR02231 family)